MLKKFFPVLPLLFLAACNGKESVTEAKISAPEASSICAGKVIAGVTGTANCQASIESPAAVGFYLFSARKDSSTLDWSDPNLLLDLIDGSVDRSAGVATLKEIQGQSNFLSFFEARYQVVPNPITDTDGRFSNGAEAIAKKNHLGRITSRPTQECGTNSALSISERVADCAAENGEKAFYNGRQYGQNGEGDWKLVTRLATGEEVWRDERTRLLWSDKAMGNPSADPGHKSHPSHGGYYNWFQASGYAKAYATSLNEVSRNVEPGMGSSCFANGGEPCQPAQPISVCAEVDSSGKIVGGGALSTYTYQANPETAFKGELGIAQNVLWKLPSRQDWQMASLNGLTKVLPKLDDLDDRAADLNNFPHDYGGSLLYWSSTTNSYAEAAAWAFEGWTGSLTVVDRGEGFSVNVRCVGIAKE